MYDIDMYKYETKPFCSDDVKYGVLPLNKEGKNIYFYSKHSHTKSYLSKYNPIIHELEDEDELIKKKIENSKKKEEQKEEKKEEQKEEKSEEVKPSSALPPKNPTQINNSNSTSNAPQKKKKILTKSVIIKNDKKSRFTRSVGKQEKSQFQTIEEGYNRLKNFELGKSGGKFKLPPIQTGTCVSKGGLYRSQTNSNYFNKHYTLPVDCRENHFNKKGASRNGILTEKDLDLFKTTLNKSIEKTLELASSPKPLKDAEKIKNDNMLMKTALTEQTSKEFLNKTRMPNLVSCSSHKILRNIGNGHSKHMGERYAPYCFIYAVKKTDSRNIFGARYAN